VFLKNTGNVFDMASLQLLAIKSKTWRDLMNDEPFTREDIITIQDPANLKSRDLRDYDYVKLEKKIGDEDLANDPLKGINVEAAGGAGKVLKMLAEKVSSSIRVVIAHTRRARSKVLSLRHHLRSRPRRRRKRASSPSARSSSSRVSLLGWSSDLFSRAPLTPDNATNFTTGQAAASFTSTTLVPQVVNERQLLDEEEREFRPFVL
jgi:peptidyl-prolyl cis-trans isomerase-like protein 2